MELMSSLLLCALVAYFPQGLGFNDPNEEVRFRARIYHQQKPQGKKILLNLNGPPLVNMISDLQYVFMDIRCHKCTTCMERAIRAYKRYAEMLRKRPTVRELQEEILTHKYVIRSKRNAESEAKLKKNKSKKKSNKSVTVTKYNVDGEVYGLRVKEIGLPDQKSDNKTALCHIYSVKKSYECDTPESDTFLSSAKRKGSNKKNKKEREITIAADVVTTSEKSQYLAQSFNKRQADLTRVDLPENFETSIEDIMSY